MHHQRRRARVRPRRRRHGQQGHRSADGCCHGGSVGGRLAVPGGREGSSPDGGLQRSVSGTASLVRLPGHTSSRYSRRDGRPRWRDSLALLTPVLNQRRPPGAAVVQTMALTPIVGVGVAWTASGLGSRTDVSVTTSSETPKDWVWLTIPDGRPGSTSSSETPRPCWTERAPSTSSSPIAKEATGTGRSSRWLPPHFRGRRSVGTVVDGRDQLASLNDELIPSHPPPAHLIETSPDLSLLAAQVVGDLTWNVYVTATIRRGSLRSPPTTRANRKIRSRLCRCCEGSVKIAWSSVITVDC